MYINTPLIKEKYHIESTKWYYLPTEHKIQEHLYYVPIRRKGALLYSTESVSNHRYHKVGNP